MRILLINVASHGSTGSITLTLKKEYEALGHEAFFICGRHGRTDKDKRIYKGAYELESKAHHLLSLFTGNIYGGMPLSTLRTKKLIKKINPDLIHLHCLNGYFVNIYSLTNFIKKKGYKCIYTMHADFMMSAGCGIAEDCERWRTDECRHCPRIKEINSRFSLDTIHRHWGRMKKAFQGFSKDKIRITAVSPWLANRVASSPIYKEYKVAPVLNPVRNVFKGPYGPSPYREKGKNILFVTTSLTDKLKGGQFLKPLAKLMPDCHFTVIIPSKQNPGIDLPNMDVITGGIPPEKLRDYYHHAYCTVLLSRRETFSMVVAESLCCGTPVAGFVAGGPETIALPEYTKFVPYGDLGVLKKAIGFLIESQPFKGKISAEGRKQYSPAEVTRSYLTLFSD